MSKFPQNWPSWSAKRWMGPPLFSTRNLFYQHVFSGCRPVVVLGYGRTSLASLLPSQGLSVMCAHACCLISKLLVLVAADVLVCVHKCDFFFFFWRFSFCLVRFTQLRCVSLLLLPRQQTNLINIRPPVSKCSSVPANETSLESVSTIAFFHSEKSIYFLDLNWFEIFIWPHLCNWTAPVWGSQFIFCE